MAQDSLYVIGIGGTGAKCLDAMMKIASVGLLTEQPMRLLFIDADETNGNLERSKLSLSVYQRNYQLLLGEQRDCPWMQTKVESYTPDVWSPFIGTNLNKNLGDFFGYNNLTQNHEELGYLFDVLYTKEEREANLDVGFRGRPAIGSGIMSRLDLDNLQDEPWASLIKQIKADQGAGKASKIFLCGSIFGGTGASGLPTLGRLIHNKLEKESVRDNVKLGCLFVLPYFQFSPPTGPEATKEVYASSDQFLLNTEAALQYYRDQNEYFDTVYLLGNQNFSKYEFSTGKNTQRNEPHFLELYAGLAARHFLMNTPANKGTVVLNSRNSREQIDWNDLPEVPEVKKALVTGARFAYVWLSNIEPELATAQKIGVNKFQKGAPWFIEFFKPEHGFMGKMLDKKGEELPDFNNTKEQTAIRVITDWCKDYLRWILEFHQCDGDAVQLFRYRAFNNLDGQLKGEYLSELFYGDTRDKGRKDQDTVQTIKENLKPSYLNLSEPKTGTVGLAKALYKLCEL
ncbi:hypothetical protein [Aphanothece sacrum]|uniref:Uncharacterized protein n=1 Tax=Aphanothece sacrum FPU1 TaxID=1920663 RepID=A0A401IC29_APHSA|nr:hypothetical protein [Aphanothece sacrum]GBF78799.1 hypothetical protein AsFPU1_0189 [Aphanothece sacrum FPU1]GBF83031.1 hypothetical protein AsFPU3_0069 [Aphanothece sacrum FPU3]